MDKTYSRIESGNYFLLYSQRKLVNRKIKPSTHFKLHVMYKEGTGIGLAVDPKEANLIGSCSIIPPDLYHLTDSFCELILSRNL